MRQAHTAKTSRPELNQRRPVARPELRSEASGAARAEPARSEASGAARAEPARSEASGATRAEPARSEASGAAQAEPAETSQRGARPVARAAGRARSQRFRVTSAHRSEPVNKGGAPGVSARGRSQTVGVRPARAEEREGIRGRPRAAGRLTKKLPSPALKEVERFWILQSRRFEHPYEGNCTARHRARTPSRASNVRRALRICADLRGMHTG